MLIVRDRKIKWSYIDLLPLGGTLLISAAQTLSTELFAIQQARSL